LEKIAKNVIITMTPDELVCSSQMDQNVPAKISPFLEQATYVE
jgi:hypothetical protein